MKLLVRFVFVWKIVDTLQSAQLLCARLQQPHLWKQRSGSCYLFLDSKLARGPAVELCRSKCAELTAPTSDEENEIAWGVFKDAVGGKEQGVTKMWLGCNNTNGAWVCLGDTPGKKYRNWWN